MPARTSPSGFAVITSQFQSLVETTFRTCAETCFHVVYIQHTGTPDNSNFC